MKRIVFVNFHEDWMLLETAQIHLFKYSNALKHGYLLKYLLDNPEYEICNFVNDRGVSLVSGGSDAFHKVLNLFSKFEVNGVYKINGLDKKKIKRIKSASQIKEDDIVIMYNVCPNSLRQVRDVKAFKALSMLHFYGKSEEDALIRNAKVDCYFNEVNLKKCSEIYQKYYTYDCPWIVHPFVYAERFKNIVPFSERKNMAFATGTITYRKHREFIETYGDSCDQPARKQIKDNQEFFADTVYCTSSDYYEDEDVKEVSSKDNKIVRLYKNLHNRKYAGKQKKYFSFDMVEAFNSYKMCIVGEEVLGIPGIGFVEGMACGCAYIGQDMTAYHDWGLIPGEHYITYDGSKEDLRRVIEYYQMDEHQAELEQIAKNGCEYVHSNFNGHIVAERLIHDLEEQQHLWKAQREK